MHSIKNQIKKYKNFIVINEEILCSLIFRIVDEFEFINILSELFNSNKLSVHAIEVIKKRLSYGNSKIIDIIDSDVLKINTPSTPNRDSNLNATNASKVINLQSLTPTPVYDSESLNEKVIKSLQLEIKVLKDDYNLSKEMYRRDKDELKEWQKRMETETHIKFNNENFITLMQEMVALKTVINNKFSSLIQTQENFFKLIELNQEMKAYNNQTRENCIDLKQEIRTYNCQTREQLYSLKTDINDKFSSLFQILDVSLHGFSQAYCKRLINLFSYRLSKVMKFKKRMEI
jgi:hypothetical protein